jgi:hypothetical protein
VADAPGTDNDRLLLDELTDQLDRTRALLRGDAEGAAELALADLGARNPREGELVRVLTDRRPLRHPDHFLDAHALVLRALEVLDRDGWRWPRLPRLWFLTSPARQAVERVARGIVRRHVEQLAKRLHKLYAQREGQATPQTLDRRRLRSARLDVERVQTDYVNPGTGLRPLLVGGAVLSTTASLFKRVQLLDVPVAVLVVGGLILLAVLMAGVSWVLLRAAALARRRADLLVREPLRALWETVGDAGYPPRDDSVTFAIAAIVLTALVWLAVPGIVGALLYLA